jgi:hypothetical protein
LLEITNKTRSPIQILVKSTQGAYNKEQGGCISTTRAFTSLNVPGIGAGENKVTIDDEKITDQIKRLEKEKLIQIKHV